MSKSLRSTQPQRSSHSFSAAIQPGNLPEPSVDIFWVWPKKTPPPQTKDASLHRPTTCVWVNGHSFIIPYYQRKAARLLCRHPNCDCQTLYWIMCREEECMSLLSLEDERAGNAKVAVLWGPVYRGRMKTCIVCMIHVPHCISIQQRLRGGRLAWNARGEGQGICILLFT